MVAVARRKSSVSVDGAKVRLLRERRLVLTQREFADKLGISEPGVRKIESLPNHTVTPKTFRALAEVFGMTLDDAKSQLSPAAEWDENLEPYSKRPLAEFPIFDLTISGSDWSDVSDNMTNGYLLTPEQLRQGLFSVIVRGPSMSPVYPDGKAVIFKLLITDDGLVDFDRLREGSDYYVQLDDSRGTFKRLVSVEPDHLVLKPLNPKMKRELVAPIHSVRQIAEAMTTGFDWNPRMRG